MQRFGKWIAVISLVAAVGAAQAQNVTGAWNGKLAMDMSKLPKAADATQQKQMDAIAKMLKGIKVNLALNANKTFTMKVTGMPAMPGAANGQKAPSGQTAEGTWSQKGSVITLKITKANGTAPKGANPPQDMKILDGGKRMELEPSNSRGMGGKIIFTR